MIQPMIALICGQDGMAERLLAQHVDDGRGRCRACPVGGQQGYQRWPCTIVVHARNAKTLLDQCYGSRLR